jgi:hypothetical protein
MTVPATNPITGIDGKLFKDSVEIAEVRNWKVMRKADNKKFSSSAKAGWQRTAKGTKNWTLSFSMYLDGGEMEIGVTEGETYTFVGHTTTGKTFTGLARVDSIGEGADIEGSAMEAADVECSGDCDYTIV